MNRNLDDKIRNSLSEEIKIPDSILAKAESAFEKIRDSEEIKTVRFPALKKQLIASVAAISILSLIIFGRPVLAEIKAFLIDRGIQKSIDNGYVQKLPENQVKSNGIAIKVDDIISDKTKMAISFTLNFDDISELDEVSDVMLDLVIKDDRGRAILEDGNANSMISGLFPQTDASLKNKGELKYYLEMDSIAGKIIDVETVLINIKSVNLYKLSQGKNLGNINGTWDFSLKLDDKFANKEEIKFKAENKTEVVDFVSAEMLPTGMFIKFIMNKPVDESIISKVTLVDEQGNIYKSSTAGMERTPDKRDLIYMTFDVTSFENKDKLKMVIRDIEEKDVELGLIKDKSQ